ncbi:MAG: AbrB/MazE/SpoVT family DNA-binding domain-containing protein [Candidatus Bathyarchaeia archaeon]
MNEFIAKVNGKGRILIPSEIRRRLNIRNVVRIIVGDGEIVLKPVEDPLRRIEKLVIKGTSDVKAEIQRLRKTAENELQREVRS